MAESKNYFDEEKVTRWIVEYQNTAIKEIGEDGKIIVTWKDKELEEKIMKEVMKIVKAVIQIYRYYVFEPYDDVFQHGSMSCYQNLMKWTKDKGTAFNYFSIIAKRSLLNYTDRRKKHRNHIDIETRLDLQDTQKNNFDFYLETLRDNLIDIINSNYVGKRRKNFIEITLILADYLYKTKKFVSKTDFYSWGRSYGKRSVDIREYMKAMRKHNEDLYLEF